MRSLICNASTAHVPLAVSIALLCLIAMPAVSQHKCEFGGEKAANSLDRDLSNAKSCKEAAALFNDCRWGSSADAGFGATAVQRCEQDFFKNLTAAQQNNYADGMQLCAYEYARQQGTISVSEAASCQVDLAASIAADRRVADKALPRASFDCGRAQSALEKAVCSDVSLGRADVVLGRVYTADLNFLKGSDRATFAENEKKWLTDVAVQCALTTSSPSREVLNCLRNAFEIRFSSLDGCMDGEGVSGCLNPDSDPEDYGDSQRADPAAPRSSFNCDSPATSLQVVICDDHELGQKDVEVTQAFEAAVAESDPATRDELKQNQAKWLEFVGSNCPLGVVGGIPNMITRGCIRSAYEIRAGQLASCAKKPAADRQRCLGDFSVLPK